MRTFEMVYDEDNLSRAWRWLRSNADAAYKSYFRHLYSNFALADTALLRDLHDRLKRGCYEPEHACKLYFPKPSGVSRPYTLLTVEDQIVYQAMVNVVAEALLPKVRSRYFAEVFGHLYAGKTSIWFYHRWQKGYDRFKQAARRAFADGFTYTASFDLTAFYDSLDHGVLRHFLSKLGCDRAFCGKLTGWLSQWTATEGRIYHGHGIPQGPLGSGLLSEVVLQHFDRNHGSPGSVRYLRYVDDIRLFAWSEKDLRRMVVKLDMLSKDIGLFPQSSKIHIHEVGDIETELKSVSIPGGGGLDEGDDGVREEEAKRRLIDLSPRFKVVDSTRFKFLLGSVRPSAKLNNRLWRILEGQPELYANVMRYFQRYKTLPRKAGDRLVAELKAWHLYGAVTAEMLRTADGRLNPRQTEEVDALVRAKWRPVKLPADLIAALGCWAFKRNLLEYGEVENAVRNVKEWWARAELVAALSDRFIGRPSFEALLNTKLSDKASDVAVGAAVHIATHLVPVNAPRSAIQPLSARILETFGILPGTAAGVCGVQTSLSRLLARPIPAIDWRAVFGPNYAQAERQALWCRAYAETDITAWVNAMDVFDDWLLQGLYAHAPSLGTYQPGSMGIVYSSTRLKRAFPAIQAMAASIHTTRGESSLSHAWVKKGKRFAKPTGPIKYSYLNTAKKLVGKALAELAAKW